MLATARLCFSCAYAERNAGVYKRTGRGWNSICLKIHPARTERRVTIRDDPQTREAPRARALALSRSRLRRCEQTGRGSVVIDDDDLRPLGPRCVPRTYACEPRKCHPVSTHRRMQKSYRIPSTRRRTRAKRRRAPRGRGIGSRCRPRVEIDVARFRGLIAERNRTR
jgi:hypothetical protein